MYGANLFIIYLFINILFIEQRCIFLLSMLVNNDSRLIFLPKEINGSYQLVSVAGESFILHDLILYQLRAMETNETPSSFVLEMQNDHGAVMNNSDYKILVATKFNLNFKLFLLLQRATRGKSIDNLVDDELSGIIDCDRNGKGIPLEVIEKYLQDASIWDVITEAGEAYYRYNQEKCLKWLQLRVERLVEFHLNYPYSSIVKQFKKDYDDASQQMIELHIRRFAVGFITHAYGLGTLFDPLSKLYDFSLLDEMIQAQKETLKQRQLVEANLRATSDTSNNQKKRPSTAKASANKRGKKAAPKVAVGKGALDSFFKKS